MNWSVMNWLAKKLARVTGTGAGGISTTTGMALLKIAVASRPTSHSLWLCTSAISDDAARTDLSFSIGYPIDLEGLLNVGTIKVARSVASIILSVLLILRD
jgi:hypothetical protein